MPYTTRVRYTGTGSQTSFAVPFPYIDRTHVHVLVNGAEVAPASWPSPSLLTLATPPASGVPVKIVRRTPASTPAAVFTNPGVLKAADLNAVVRQLLFIEQEHEDGLSDALSLADDGTMNAAGKRVSNAANPVDAQDLVTKGYFEGVHLPATAALQAGINSVRADALTLVPDGTFGARGKRVSSAGDPIGATDLATKQYTDALRVALQDLTQRIEAAAVIGAAAYTPSGTGTYTRSIAGKLEECRSVLDWIDPGLHAAIQAGTYTGNLTSQLQAAFASGHDLFIPRGRYPLRGKLLFARYGQKVVGAGRRNAVFVVPADASLAVSSYIELTHFCELSQIGFDFDQSPAAASGLRSSLVAYPWAIDISNATRVKLDQIELRQAYRGINGLGNCGGSYVGDLEIGAFHTGMAVDGPLDFFHGKHWHFWLFDFAANANLSAIYSDGTTVAFAGGLIDGLSVDTLAVFHSAVRFTSAGANSAGRIITTLMLDGDGSDLQVDAGPLTVGNVYWTKSAAPTRPSILVTGGEVRIGVIDARVSTSASDVKCTGGTLEVLGGRHNQNNTAQCGFEAAGGHLYVSDTLFTLGGNSVLTKAYLRQTTGALKVWDCDATRRGTGSGTLIEYTSDNAENVCSGNDFGKWGYVPPAGSVGMYGPNRVASAAWTPSLVFSAPGDSACSYVVQLGRYRHETGGVSFEGRVVATFNSYSSAGGTLRIAGLPIANGGVDSIPVDLGHIGGITYTSGYSAISAGLSGSSIEIRQMGSGQPVSAVGPSNVPGGTQVDLSFSGFIPAL